MSDAPFFRDQTQLLPLLREQLNEMMAAAQGLDRLTKDQQRNAAHYLAVIRQGMYRQLSLIRRLELERWLHDENEVRLSFAPTDLAALGRDLTEQVRRAVNDPAIRVEFRSELSALPTLADPFALEDMLLFLLSNSLKSVGREGAVTLTLEQQEEHALFTLSGTGGGPDIRTLSDLPREEAEEENGLSAPSAVGTGLPLARQIALLHGGTLMLDDQKGATRFLITLPLRDPSRRPDLHASRRNDCGGWDKVLVELSDCLDPRSYLQGNCS